MEEATQKMERNDCPLLFKFENFTKADHHREPRPGFLYLSFPFKASTGRHPTTQIFSWQRASTLDGLTFDASK
jgi:hypothetical protein